jgi:hypothetical protein
MLATPQDGIGVDFITGFTWTCCKWGSKAALASLYKTILVPALKVNLCCFSLLFENLLTQDRVDSAVTPSACLGYSPEIRLR